MGKYDFALELFEDNPLAKIAEEIRKDSKVLEFGPANGRLTQYLNKEKGCIIDIVEIDLESGTDASKYAEYAYLGEEKGDIEKYYWFDANKKYDYIVFADVLEHLVNPWDVLKRCKLMMASNARILVSIPNVAHNSIILGLMKGEFKYNSTGLLDNTHLRFFTRDSFVNMAREQGLAVIDEYAINVRVGENEIESNYTDVPKAVYKELMNLPNGNAYQYVFSLASNEEYLSGNCQHRVSLDRTSYYRLQVMYEVDGEIDYKNCVEQFYNPYLGVIQTEVPVAKNSKRAVCEIINSNAILENCELYFLKENGEKCWAEYKQNGVEIGEQKYYLHDNPRFEIVIPDNCLRMIINVRISDYDFEISIYEKFISLLSVAWKKIDELETRYQQSVDIYEKEIEKKNREFADSVQTYEAEIQRREEEKRLLQKPIRKRKG